MQGETSFAVDFGTQLQRTICLGLTTADLLFLLGGAPAFVPSDCTVMSRWQQKVSCPPLSLFLESFITRGP